MAPTSEVLGSNEHSHILIENIGKICLLRGIKSMTIYGCVMCKKGYHVNCFAMYHCAGALTGEAKALSKMLMKVEKLPRASNCRSKYVGTIADLKLPVLTEKNKLQTPKKASTPKKSKKME
jgi:hypothetical protein